MKHFHYYQFNLSIKFKSVQIIKDSSVNLKSHVYLIKFFMNSFINFYHLELI